MKIKELTYTQSYIKRFITTKREIQSPVNTSLFNTKQNLYSNYKWRLFNDSDTQYLCSWIKSKDALKLISSDHGYRLTHEIVSSWIQKSFCNVVATDMEGKVPIGFCTLSLQEADHLPLSAIELCHLMVKPCQDYFSVGSYLCTKAKIISKLFDFSILVGRVVPTNIFGISLALSQGFKIIHSSEKWTTPGFIWFVSMKPQFINNEEKNEN